MKRPLGVLVGVTSKSWGGNETWAAEAAVGLSERGHRVKAFCSYDAVCRRLADRDLTTQRVMLWGDLNPVGLASLLRLFRKERPDAVILSKQREYWLGGLAAKLGSDPLVALRMGLRRRLRDDFKRRMSFGRLSDLVIVNSESVREAALEAPWLDPGKVRVLLNSVSLEPVSRNEGLHQLDDLGLPRGVPVICGAGRLTRQKGFDLLIQSLSLVRREVGDARLLILGEGGQRGALEQAARDSGVSDSVIFAGHLSNVRTVLAAVRVYVLSSRNEGMANSLLEAMSVGAPIVATDVSGTTEAVRHGAEALVVPPGDPAGLARAIVRVLTDGELASSLGSASRVRARERFGKKRMLDELEAMLEEGVEEKRRRLNRTRPS